MQIPRKFVFSVVMVIGFFSSCLDEKTEVLPDELLKAQRWLDPGIYDGNGRFMLMRGVNLNTLGDYWAGVPSIPATGSYEPDHFQIMASYGFNVVRLLFHWSELEPVRGQYNYSYIDRIRQAIEDAAEYDIYIQLDMHQDAYSKFIVTPTDVTCEYPSKGWDGAPEWATLTDGVSTWNNKEGIRDDCIAAWQELVRATAHYKNLLGYDVLNEPALGDGDLSDQLAKYNDYLKALVRAIRLAEGESGGYEHIFFFETTVGWNGEQIPSTPAFNFTQDQNIVFAPHNYFEVIGPPVLTIEQGAALYSGLADSYGTHCFIGEWGVFGNPATGLSKLKRFAAAEDAYFMGSTWWQWCQAPGDPHAVNWEGTQYAERSLHLMEILADGSYSGVRNDLFLNVLGRARPVAIHGQPLELVSDPDTGNMRLKAKAGSEGETVLWIPDRFGEPSIFGTNIGQFQLFEVEGGFKASVRVQGSYEIEVSY